MERAGATFLSNNDFACNTNGGAQTLVGSYVPPAGLNAVNGNQVTLELHTNAATLSPWWSMGTGGCTGRTTTPTSDFNFQGGPFGCTDYWAGQASGGIAYSSVPPDRARIHLVGAIAEALATSQDPSTEYYSFKISISNAGTVGLGSCAGCTDGVCIVFQSLRITQNPPETLNPTLTNPVIQNWVTWHGGDGNCPASTPARTTTWGSVKARYR